MASSDCAGRVGCGRGISREGLPVRVSRVRVETVASCRLLLPSQGIDAVIKSGFSDCHNRSLYSSLVINLYQDDEELKTAYNDGR